MNSLPMLAAAVPYKDEDSTLADLRRALQAVEAEMEREFPADPALFVLVAFADDLVVYENCKGQRLACSPWAFPGETPLEFRSPGSLALAVKQ